MKLPTRLRLSLCSLPAPCSARVCVQNSHIFCEGLSYSVANDVLPKKEKQNYFFHLAGGGAGWAIAGAGVPPGMRLEKKHIKKVLK